MTIINNKRFLLLILFYGMINSVFGQDTKIEIPGFGDKYSKYVQQLEAGHLDIDYTDFRNSFLSSRLFDNIANRL
jgi:hypothetical protein